MFLRDHDEEFMMDQDEATRMDHDHVFTTSHDNGTLMNHNVAILVDSENGAMVPRVGETMMDHGHVLKFPWHDYPFSNQTGEPV